MFDCYQKSFQLSLSLSFIIATVISWTSAVIKNVHLYPLWSMVYEIHDLSKTTFFANSYQNSHFVTLPRTLEFKLLVLIFKNFKLFVLTFCLQTTQLFSASKRDLIDEVNGKWKTDGVSLAFFSFYTKQLKPTYFGVFSFVLYNSALKSYTFPLKNILAHKSKIHTPTEPQCVVDSPQLFSLKLKHYKSRESE